MGGFTIDDVRDSFERDINEMLTQGRSRLGSLRQSRVADGQSFEGDLVHVDRLVGIFHSIHGTTALVDATGLATTSKSLEAVAEELKSSIRIVAHETAKIREMLGSCEQGFDGLARMLRLELDGARDAATAAAAELDRARAQARRTSSTSFEAVPASVDPIQLELREVFESEAMSLLEEVENGVSRLEVSGDVEADMTALRRAFHTLKGASAMVGLAEASAVAQVAHEHLDTLIEDGAVDAHDAIRRARRAARKFLEHTPVPALRSRFAGTFGVQSEASSEASAKAKPSMADQEIAEELLEVFLEELEEARGSLTQAFAAWRRAPGSLAEPASIGRTMHQLKGAAATVGKSSVVVRAAELQGRLEAIVESTATVDVTFIKKLERDVSGFVAQCGARPLELSSEADPSSTAAGLFARESREILGSALNLAEGLLAATIDDAKAINERLAQLFHRLKGSALIDGDSRVPRIAERLQRLAESGEITALAVRSGVDELSTLVGVVVSATPSGVGQSASSMSQPSVVDVSIDPALWEAFEQEFRELTDGIDATVLGLETSDDPRKEIAVLLRSVHTLKGAVNTVGMSPTGQMLHAVEDMLEALQGRASLPALRELTKLFVFVQSEVRRQLKQARSGRVGAPVQQIEGRIRRMLSEDDGSGRGYEERPSEASRRSADASDMALGTGDTSTIRVPTARLDSLMNLAGELVVYRSKLSSRVAHLGNLHRTLDENRRSLLEVVDEFRTRNEFSLLRSGQVVATRDPVVQAAQTTPAGGFSELELDRYDEVNLLSRKVAELTDDVNEVSSGVQSELGAFGVDADALSTVISGIQGEVTRARMIPLDVLFTRLRMPIRDAADREDREVKVTTRGGEVSLDKMVADALFQPLLHVVRNAVVHGVEPPDQRQRAGKAREGTITLSAREDAGQVVIEVEDDGAGLALDKLRRLGIERGVLPANVDVDDPAVKEMVFVAGVSTRDKAGDVSGRGVGGDVVKRAVQKLNGRIEIRSAERAGTKFTIFLPISLAISKALVVRVGEKTFALPLHFAERIIAKDDASFVDSAGSRRLRLQDTMVPVHDVHRALRLAESSRSAGAILVLRFGDQRLAFTVDAVVAQEEIVIKDLGELFVNHPLFSGVTIRGTGELVLLFDVSALFERHFKAEARKLAPARAAAQTPAVATASESLVAASTEVRPIDKGAQLEATVAAHLVAPRGITVTSTLRVLFVDDSLSVRKVAERMLESIGVDATLAVDGVDALEKLRGGGFDLVFTDLEMPRMNGFDLLRELRFLPSFAALPVVIVSSRSGSKHREQAEQLGANDYLSKPFTEAQVRSVLATLVPKKKLGGKKRA